MIESPRPWTTARRASTSPRPTRPRPASSAWPRARSTPRVLSEIGSFGGMFRPDFARYREPVLVASTDGVGTKIQVAIAAGVHDTVGYDLVAHCVERHPGAGRRPALLPRLHRPREDGPGAGRGHRAPASRAAAPSSAARSSAARPPRCPGPTPPDDYDLAGFIVGVVEQRAGPSRRGVREGDVLLGLPSAGLHTNGYTLARKVLFDDARPPGRHPRCPSSARPSGEALLAPHRATSPPSSRSSSAARSAPSPTSPAAASPATSRACCPTGLGARVRRGAWEVPPLFRLIQ